MIQERSAFKVYLDNISQYKLLTREQEMELAYKMREGDGAAKEMLINSNLRLVVTIAKGYLSVSNMKMEDLVAEGNLGLIVAVNKFNPDLGYRFSTCAVPWIKQAIIKAITDKSKSIRIPTHIYAQIQKMNRVVDALEKDGYVNPTNEEIGRKMGITPSKVEELKAWKRQPVSMDTPLGDETENTIEDVIPDNNAERPEEYASNSMEKIRIQKAMEQLPERTRKILQMRNGLQFEGDPEDWNKVFTLEEIGAILGITRERVRQIEKKGQEQLKLILRSR